MKIEEFQDQLQCELKDKCNSVYVWEDKEKNMWHPFEKRYFDSSGFYFRASMFPMHYLDEPFIIEKKFKTYEELYEYSIGFLPSVGRDKKLTELLDSDSPKY